MPLPEREAVPGIGPRRAEIIVAGAQVFRGTAGELRAARISIFGLWDYVMAFSRRCWPQQDDRGPPVIGSLNLNTGRA